MTTETTSHETESGEAKQRMFDAEQALITQNVNFTNTGEAFHSEGNVNAEGRTLKEFQLLRLAGSGILLPPEELDAFIENLATSRGCVCCMDERVRYPEENTSAEELVISWHKGCGAVGIFYEGKDLGAKTIDQKAEEWAHLLAEKVREKTGRKVSVKEMTVENPEFHYAGVLYYDRTGKFNDKRDPKLKLPDGLIVGRANMTAKSASTETEAAITRIMFGAHGLPEYFSKENPFVLVAIGGDKKELEESLKELEDVKEKVIRQKPDLDGKIAIKGFVRPPTVDEKETSQAA